MGTISSPEDGKAIGDHEVIRIHRPPAPPDPETAKRLKAGQIKVMEFIKAKGRQSRFDFSPKYWGRAKELLRELQHDKCAYCESSIGVTTLGDLENFRPKGTFPELAYEWNNLLVACQKCNINKRDQFPTEEDGTPLLVDPSSEDPGESISFDDAGVALPKTPKGEATIKTIALNRPDLTKARAKAIRNYLKSGEGLPGDDVAYAGAIRSVLTSMPARRPTGEPPVSPSDKAARQLTQTTTNVGAAATSPSAKREFAYISSIHITNFRALTRLKLNVPLSDSLPGWQVLLGENATGKSTVLKAIAIALMGSEFLPSVTAYRNGILRRHKDKSGVHESRSGSVTITFVNGETTELKFNRSGLYFESGAAGMHGTIRGYGSMRLLPEDDDDSRLRPTTADVGNLFHPRQSLVNAEKLLIGLYASDRPKFEQFGTHIKYLLRLEGALDVAEGELWVPINGTPVRIAELSDGYQAMIALAVDLMHSFTDVTSMEFAPGILLLDELGTHLHPRWRLELVDRIRSTFRGLQVIATTHEPLCLRGLKKGEVGLLRRDQSGNVEFVKDDDFPNIEAMRVDQILTSPIFGLHSTIDPKTEADFVRYYALLAKSTLTSKEEQERSHLALRLRPHRHLAYTRRDQLMYDIIDKCLAEEANAPHHRQKQLRSKTMEQLRDIWYEDGIPK